MNLKIKLFLETEFKYSGTIQIWNSTDLIGVSVNDPLNFLQFWRRTVPLHLEQSSMRILKSLPVQKTFLHFMCGDI